MRDLQHPFFSFSSSLSTIISRIFICDNSIVQDCITFIPLIFFLFFSSLLLPFFSIFPSLDRIMARTKEDLVASKGDASPEIPKSSAGVTKSTAEAPAKRGRGRPPKGAAPMPKKVYVPTGRPRGRPPASGAKKAAAAAKKAKAVTAAAARAAAQNDDGTPKKGRGRPRKAAAAATSDEEPAATTPKEPKKRGRKPKAVEAEVSGDEADDAEPADEDSDKEAATEDTADSPGKDEDDGDDYE
ncbi:hypothetical protein KAF25_008858 [Fusarium avenaceum]|uniref:Uncharacterized protein n=1 Tax=Fusarium avenaceum TaxID=40199 RepID=A0A9P7KN19_9HYPO|nr:hypothetical protein KAF25_008858 [Fusarium avenaceum]